MLKKYSKLLLDKSLIIFNKIKPILLSIVIGLLFGFILMIIFNPNRAVSGMRHLLFGVFTFGGIKGFGDVLFKATPIIVAGVALIFSFKSGLFNIGASGQMIVGSYVAIHIGVLWNLPSPIHWIVAIILGAIAGGIWGLIPGLLKAYRNTNEVVATIMMNYIGTLLVIFMIKTYVYSPDAMSQDIQSTAWLPRFGQLFGDSQVNIGFLIAIAIAIIAYFIIFRTKLGFELQSSGFNPDGSKYAGMNEKKNIILSMTVSGLLAGLAGTLIYLSFFIDSFNSLNANNLGIDLVLLPQGFDGISVALLSLNNPIGAIFSGIFLSLLKQGGSYLTLDGYIPQLSEIITSVVIYTIAISSGIQMYIKKVRTKRLMTKKIKEGEL